MLISNLYLLINSNSNIILVLNFFFRQFTGSIWFLQIFSRLKLINFFRTWPWLLFLLFCCINTFHNHCFRSLIFGTTLFYFCFFNRDITINFFGGLWIIIFGSFFELLIWIANLLILVKAFQILFANLRALIFIIFLLRRDL